MKSKYYSISRFFLIFTFISAVSIGTAAAQPSGRLLVMRPANFGWNLAFNLEIDGRDVGNFVQGRYYHGWLSAGDVGFGFRLSAPIRSVLDPWSAVANGLAGKA